MALHELQKGFHEPASRPKGRRNTARKARKRRRRHNQLEGSAPPPPRDAGKGGTPAVRYWQTTTLEDAISFANTICNKIVTFSLNIIFEIPECNAAKEFIKEITFLL